MTESCLRKVNGKTVEILRFVPLTLAGHPSKARLPRKRKFIPLDHGCLSPEARQEPASLTKPLGAGSISGARG